MKRSTFIACLLALCGVFVGCVADTTESERPGSFSRSGAEAEPPSTGEESRAGYEATPPEGSEAQGQVGAAGAAASMDPTDVAVGSGDAEGEPAPTQTYAGEAQQAEPAEALDVDEHLQRLGDLRLFEVEDLVRAVPGENYSCAYNQPCPGDELDGVMRAQGARLAALVEVAEEVSATAELPEATRPPQDDLAILRDLSIVHIGELIVDEPASSPFCYNLPCPSDVAEADASNARRSQVLAELVQRSDDL